MDNEEEGTFFSPPNYQLSTLLSLAFCDIIINKYHEQFGVIL